MKSMEVQAGDVGVLCIKELLRLHTRAENEMGLFNKCKHR